MLVPLESCGHTCSTHSALGPLFLFAALWQHHSHVAVVGFHITVLPRWVKLKWHHANPSGPVYRLPWANPLESLAAQDLKFEIILDIKRWEIKRNAIYYYIIIVNIIHCMINKYNIIIYHIMIIYIHYIWTKLATTPLKSWVSIL